MDLDIINHHYVIIGCSAEEVIRVGTPFNHNGNEGVEFHNEITDSESITHLRTIIDKVKEIEEPNDINKEPEIFFSLDRPKDGISEIRFYLTMVQIVTLPLLKIYLMS